MWVVLWGQGRDAPRRRLGCDGMCSGTRRLNQLDGVGKKAVKDSVVWVESSEDKCDL